MAFAVAPVSTVRAPVLGTFVHAAPVRLICFFIFLFFYFHLILYIHFILRHVFACLSNLRAAVFGSLVHAIHNIYTYIYKVYIHIYK